MAENQEFDNEASLQEAKRRLPLVLLMQQHGDTPPPIGKKWAGCPFCKKKDTARITDDGKQQFFKCANDNCLSDTAGEGNAWTELHYLKFKTGWSDRDVFIAYLKEANVWKERERLKSPEEVQSPKPEVQGQEAVTPAAVPEETPTAAPIDPVDDSADADKVDDELIIQQCLAVILEENRASVSLIQRRLRLGYTRALRIMTELEKRGMVGPSKGAEPRDILVEKPEPPKSESQLMDEDIAKWIDYLKRAEKRTFHFLDLEKQFGFERAQKLLEEMQMRKVASAIGSDFELVPTVAPTVTFISSVAKEPGQPPPGKIDGEDGYAALHEFFMQLPWLPSDEEKIFRRRGVKSTTSTALCFRSNPRTNRALLLAMPKSIAKDELLDSGLFMRVKNRPMEVKPNSQFCGAGIIRKAKPGEEPARNEWKDADGNIWGWCQPILIPYFDEMGRLISLRPHKGGGLAKTLTGSPRIYIPRSPRSDGKQIKEIFPVVIITEGEFKAAALYQTIGAGRIDEKEPYGVVALPGIWFGQNYSIREELDQWLRDVRCRVVKVAYDNEEKGDSALESYKPDRRKRFDAEICARTLATDLANKLHIRGEVCRLPDTWRNEKGKADWDGALVQLTQPKESK